MITQSLKKIISVVLLFSIPLIFSLNCATSRNLQKPALEELVVEMKGYKANYLYESIQVYAAKKWANPQAVTRYADKQSQKLVISGYLMPEEKDQTNPFGGYSYITQGVLTFYVKDDRFKITLENTSTITKVYNGYGQVVSTDEETGVMTKHLNLLSQIADEAKESITKQKNQESF